MNRLDFFYSLPPELIAQEPAAERSASRMLALDLNTGEIAHRRFYDIAEYLRPGDCLVLNDSRVIPARLYGVNARTGGRAELLLHERLDESDDARWTALVKPGRRARRGDCLSIGDGAVTATVLDTTADGLRVVALAYDGALSDMLNRYGVTPLPHYINKQPGAADAERYQTVYAKHDGSVAAPTAGLHFTDEILGRLRAKGVNTARVTLHVGLGTFKPVKADDITEHHMHSEYCRVGPGEAAMINAAKQSGGRVIAVGTTACRTLESRAEQPGRVSAGSGRTDIFIYPGYKFKIIDGLITNFHMPESTLLMLVSAFAGRERVMEAYQQAIDMRYRFFSYGDCCLFI